MNEYYDKLSTKYPQLSQDEVLPLLKEYRKSKDPVIAERIVLAHVKLILKLISEKLDKKYYDYFDDIFQECILKLYESLDNYDFEKNTKFSSYAYFYIIGGIYKSFSKLFKNIKIPCILKRDITKLKKYIKNYKEVNGMNPSKEDMKRDLSDKMQYRIEDVFKMLTTSEISLDRCFQPNSLSVPILYNNNSYTEKYSNVKMVSKYFDEYDETFLHLISKYVSFKPIEFEILCNMVDHPNNKLTLRELGEKLNLTFQRVQQIQDNVKRKILKSKAHELFECYI